MADRRPAAVCEQERQGARPSTRRGVLFRRALGGLGSRHGNPCDLALIQEIFERLREVAEAQLVTQRETNRLLYALATQQDPNQVAPAPVEPVAQSRTGPQRLALGGSTDRQRSQTARVSSAVSTSRRDV